MRPFCRKNHVHKIPRFRGGGIWGFWGGGGSADFIFMGARVFLILGSDLRTPALKNRERFSKIDLLKRSSPYVPSRRRKR